MIKKISKDYFKISAKNIHLDSDNPRHDYKSRESEIIKELCDPKLVALAKDIAEMESLSPLDILGVVPNENMRGHYIALEGNRRTCALLLLADPSRAPDSSYKEKFERIARSRNIPKELTVYIFSDRKEAQPWLDRRHMGQQGGVGTADWDANAQARRASKDNAEKSTAHANVLALAVVDRLLGIGRINENQKKEIKITTLARYLNNKGRQTIIGLGGLSKDNQLIYTHTPHIVDEILERFVIDSIPPNKNERAIVHSRADANDCLVYLLSITRDKLSEANKLAQSIEIHPTTPAVAPQNSITHLASPASIGGSISANAATQQVSFSESSTKTSDGQLTNEQDNLHSAKAASTEAASEAATVATTTQSVEDVAGIALEAQPATTSTSIPINESTGNSSPGRSVQNRADRNKVLEAKFTVQVNDKVLIRLRTEMLSTETEGHEFAANYLLRAFVERILVLYYRRNNPTRKYQGDLELAKRCAEEVTRANAPRNIQDVLSQSSNNSHIAHSLYTLGTGIHGGTIPTKRQLNAVFDTWEPALRYMLDAISASTAQTV
ncbi:hypothetical protein [Comamonas kerstersii]|uniref:hypothetical protein n=1 Tax=Comamonas kerstersii TaxID=225992 RepID=UPI001063C686|nr:hypothetical protein [Comamonas kerstersii]